MLSRSLTLAALVLMTAAPACVASSATEQKPEELGSVEQATTATCAGSVLRLQLNGTISTSATAELANQTGGVNTATAYKKRCTPEFTMNVGDRHYVKMVGANGGGSSNPASIWVERSGVKVKTRSTAGTSTEILDWTVDVASAAYRVCAVADDGTESGSDYVRLTSDRSNPALCGGAGTSVDFCFGAIGSNCDGVYLVSACSTKSNAKVDCQVSVGGNLHDTCCSHNPGGYKCGGSGNPSNWPSDCTSEYDHASNDVGTTRQWTRTYDPTEPFYRSNDSRVATSVDKSGDYATWTSFSSYDNRHRGKPTANSLLTPVGKALWDVDAQNGWCTNPTKYKTYWSLQGNYSVCCDANGAGC